ncbi:ABC transporter substrate binding protein [Fluviispira vulneris]|uniref:ABC transporter substrate binding protein n=1 Tax=Fluviispira vulneris TaxID=2763012 RepID=UPI001646C15D|nr:ABC transporter substrate binding protein [Fluviispira vulneris]
MHKYIWKTIILFFLLSECVFAGEKDIVVIESYSKNYKWDLDYTNEIIKRLGSHYKIHLFEMNTKVLPKSQHEGEALKGWDFILKINPTLVILGDDAALKYLGPKVEEKKIRTVYLGINNNPRVYFKSTPKYVTGILERPLIRRSALFIKDIIPKAKNVLILFDKDRTSEIVFEDFFLSKPSVVFSDVKFDIFLVDKFAKWKNIILQSPKKYDAIVVGLYHTLVDENSKNVDSNDVIKWTSENAKIPLFAFWDFAVGKNKAMGGLVLPGAGQGKAAAGISEKILKDKNILPGSILPIYLQEGIFIFSKYELKKANIKLPESIQNNSTFID